eukprot:g29206.t1
MSDSKGLDRVNAEKMFPLMGESRNRGHRLRVKGHHFKADMRRTVFSQRVENLWNSLPQRAVVVALRQTDRQAARDKERMQACEKLHEEQHQREIQQLSTKLHELERDRNLLVMVLQGAISLGHIVVPGKSSSVPSTPVKTPLDRAISYHYLQEERQVEILGKITGPSPDVYDGITRMPNLKENNQVLCQRKRCRLVGRSPQTGQGIAMESASLVLLPTPCFRFNEKSRIAWTSFFYLLE